MKGFMMAGVKFYTVLGIVVLLFATPCVVNASLQSEFDDLPDGSIIAWGNDDNQVSDVPEFSDFKAIAAGRNHSLAVRADGSLVAWGDNTNGETDIPEGGGYVAVAVGWNHSLALHSGGSISAWGLNNSEVPDPNEYFVEIAAGIDFSLGRKTDGSVVGWGGSNAHGQRTIPALGAGEKYKAISAGGYHALAIVSNTDPQIDDKLVAWGWDIFGQATVLPDMEFGNYIDIAAGTYHSVALLDDGTIIVWGNILNMGQVPAVEDGFKSVSAGKDYCMARRNDNSIEVWGNLADPNLVDDIPSGNIYEVISAGYDHALTLANPPVRVITPNGREFLSADTVFTITWETQNDIDNVIIDLSTDFGETYLPEYSVTVSNDEPKSYSWEIPSVNSAVCRIRISDAADPNRYDESDHPFTVYPPNVGVIVGWGDDTNGKVSDVPDAQNCDMLAAGEEYSLALLKDGSVLGWGKIYPAETGVIPADPNYTDIAAGAAFYIALHKDSSIYCWGINYDGQVSGVPAGNDFIDVAAGAYHGLAINDAGDVKGWGKSTNGQANDQIGINAIAIAAGGNQSIAILDDGSLLAWGNNDYGQWNEPTGSFTAVASGREHHLALREDKSLVAWGNTNPAIVPTGNDYIAVAAGDSYSLALREDGTIVGWGNNPFGQITVPVGYDFFKIVAGKKHVLAFGNPAFTVIDPIKDELLRSNTEYAISWYTHAIAGGKATMVNLYYSVDDGANWVSINPDTEGDEDLDPDPIVNSGIYENWLVPEATSKVCRIKLQNGDDTEIAIISDPFGVYTCTLSLDGNNDCEVDLLDFALFAGQWLQCGNPFDTNCYIP